MFKLGGGGGMQRNAKAFEVDDSLSELSQVRKYTRSSVAIQRHVYVQRISSCARELGRADTVKFLLPLIREIVGDKEVTVRQALAVAVAEVGAYLLDRDHEVQDAKQALTSVGDNDLEQAKNSFNVAPLKTPDMKAPSSAVEMSNTPSKQRASFHFQNNPLNNLSPEKYAAETPAYAAAMEQLIPVLHSLITDRFADVRDTAIESLVTLAKAVRAEHVGDVILTYVLNLAHDPTDETRTTSIQLMGLLAPLFGPELCLGYVASDLASFAEDTSFRVRKAAAMTIGVVSKTVGSDAMIRKLLEPFVRMSHDLIWGVRRGCIDSLVDMTLIAPDEYKYKTFMPMFERFRQDSSRWVREKAYEIVGPFIHALGPEVCTPEFLAHYTSIPSLPANVVDPEVRYHCAFNFPCVMLTVGAGGWSRMKPCFLALAKDNKFTVRRPMASGLHEVCAIVGVQTTQEELVPFALSFMQDIDPVVSAFLKHFGRFLRCVDIPTRLSFIANMWMIQTQNAHWRWRHLLAQQFDEISMLYNPADAAEQIWPVGFAFLKDNVAAVRQAMAVRLGPLLRRFECLNGNADADGESGEFTNVGFHAVLVEMFKMSTAPSYKNRQLFIRICVGCFGVLSAKSFASLLLPRLVHLAADSVPNVRLLLAQSCHYFLLSPYNDEADADAQNTIREQFSLIREAFTRDDDKDVKIHSTHPLPLEQLQTLFFLSLRPTTSADQLLQVIAEDKLWAEAKSGNAPLLSPKLNRNFTGDDEKHGTNISSQSPEIQSDPTLSPETSSSTDLSQPPHQEAAPDQMVDEEDAVMGDVNIGPYNGHITMETKTYVDMPSSSIDGINEEPWPEPMSELSRRPTPMPVSNPPFGQMQFGLMGNTLADTSRVEANAAQAAPVDDEDGDALMDVLPPLDDDLQVEQQEQNSAMDVDLILENLD